ncbi:hypothetical protein D3273_24720 [Lichenibacterium minor]|uniref:Uncharacterized protein n=1 Tax=Lichenibacterium minor TaxID=2316528 RepID=A0A4Q2U369_9HYPH|nr:hypothetical protein [Lichenibacterium minor]RYC29317.1 hypothetical protein D3273_24720 [Lichenibacterium minor]
MPRSTYPMALDAAPQDGRWLDDPKVQAKVLTFLLSKLSPADLAELDSHLVEGTEPQASDHRIPEGNLKRDFLHYTPRHRRAMAASLSGAGGHLTTDEVMRLDPDHGKSFEERFGPNATRLAR